MSHLRIELAQVGQHSRVFFVASNGTETDVSSIVTSIEVDSVVGEVTTAKLGIVKVSGEAEGKLVHLLANDVEG